MPRGPPTSRGTLVCRVGDRTHGPRASQTSPPSRLPSSRPHRGRRIMRRCRLEGNGIVRHPHTVTGRFVAVAIGATVLAACGGQAASMPAPPSRVEGLRSTSAVERIGLEQVAAEALDPQPLTGLLETAGFRSAVERTYAGSSPAIRRVVVRIVRFESTSGANRYLGWLREHVSDVIRRRGGLAAEHPFREAPVYDASANRLLCQGAGRRPRRVATSHGRCPGHDRRARRGRTNRHHDVPRLRRILPTEPVRFGSGRA